jgi:hypothetical protein
LDDEDKDWEYEGMERKHGDDARVSGYDGEMVDKPKKMS